MCASPSHVNTQPLVAISTGFLYWLECTFTMQSRLLSCLKINTAAETVFSNNCSDVVCIGNSYKHFGYGNFTIYSTSIDPGKEIMQ